MTTPLRTLRVCDVCGGVDDHPHHVQHFDPPRPSAVASEEFLQSLGDVPAHTILPLVNGSVQSRHMDCCAAAGCSDCRATEATHAGLRGAQLIDHLESGAVDHLGSGVAPSTEA